MRLTHRVGRRTEELYQHSRFRAAYDFLVLRAKAGDRIAQRFANWWQSYSAADRDARLSLIAELERDTPRRRHRRRKK